MLKCPCICKWIAFTNNELDWIIYIRQVEYEPRWQSVAHGPWGGIHWVGFPFLSLRFSFCVSLAWRVTDTHFVRLVSHSWVLAHRCYYSGIEQTWTWWGYKGSVPFCPRAEGQKKPFIVISRAQRKICDGGCFALYESWYLWKPKVCPFVLPLSVLCSTGI